MLNQFDEDMDPKVRSMFEKVGEFLSAYRSGKMPIPFKMLPRFANWEQVRFLL